MSRNNKFQRYGKSGFLGLLLMSGSACWAENPQASGDDYRVVDLKPVQVEVAHLGLTNCTSTLALSTKRALAACRSEKMDKEDDYGLRLYLLATDTPKASILSTSRGLGDAYTVTLQQRSNATAKYKDLILADAAAEYAYGAAVYQLNGDKLNYLGEIGYVKMSSEKNPISALDITTIKETKDGFTMSFTKDVFRMNQKGEYEHVDTRKATLVFDGKKIR